MGDGVCSFCQSVVGLDSRGLVVNHLVGGVSEGAVSCEGGGSEPECVVGAKLGCEGVKILDWLRGRELLVEEGGSDPVTGFVGDFEVAIYGDGRWELSHEGRSDEVSHSGVGLEELVRVLQGEGVEGAGVSPSREVLVREVAELRGQVEAFEAMREGVEVRVGDLKEAARVAFRAGAEAMKGRVAAVLTMKGEVGAAVLVLGVSAPEFSLSEVMVLSKKG